MNFITFNYNVDPPSPLRASARQSEKSFFERLTNGAGRFPQHQLLVVVEEAFSEAVEQVEEVETVGTGLFSPGGGLVVNTNGSGR